MSLPLNQQYGNLTSAISSLGKTASQIGRSLPSRTKRAVDVSGFSPIVTGVKKGLSAVKQKLGTVSTPFGGSTRYEKFHPGVDIANEIGTPVPSFVQGKVAEVSTGHKQGESGYGNYVIVVDSGGNKHRFSHLNQTFVKIGQTIPQGYVFGTMGNTGSTYSPSGKGTGSHLDYRVRDIYNKYVNPSKFI